MQCEEKSVQHPWGEYKLKNQVLRIDVGCLTDSLDQFSEYLKINHRLFKKTPNFSAPEWILEVTQYKAWTGWARGLQREEMKRLLQRGTEYSVLQIP